MNQSGLVNLSCANVSTVAVQNYITAILLFLVMEMLMTWGFYGSLIQWRSLSKLICVLTS